MAASTSQVGARHVAESEQWNAAQAQQEKPAKPARKKRVIVKTGAYGTRLIPVTAPLFELAAAHAGVDVESFTERVLSGLSCA